MVGEWGSEIQEYFLFLYWANHRLMGARSIVGGSHIYGRAVQYVLRVG
jgi:hypothetical protein